MHWGEIAPDGEALRDFTQKLIQLRQDNALFRRASYRDGASLRWFNAGGGEQSEEAWDDVGATTIGLLLANPKAPEGVKLALILLNPFHDDVEFTLPEHADKRPWRVVVDTAAGTVEPNSARVADGKYGMMARSLVVLC
jgi:glycogen operon protein